MPRPRKCRRIINTPEVTYFKPRGVPLRELAEVYLSLEGFEAIRLADHHGLGQEEAAYQMHVSRQTFGRILTAARQTVAKALVEGLALRIHGGDYQLLHQVDAGNAHELPETMVGNAAAGFNTEPSKERGTTMPTKVAITSDGPTLDDAVDPRFGRAAGFIVVNVETMAFEYVPNGSAQVRAQGAGIEAAQTVARTGATVVLTGYVGPKAFQALTAAGIKVAQDMENLTVRQAIEKFKNGNIAWADASQAKGMGQ